MISTRLGLKGKIDLVLKDDENRIVDVLELKSSTPDRRTGTIREYHELQVVSYGILVLMKQQTRFQDLNGETPSVLYSKTIDNIRRPARFDSDIFAKVFKYRNILLNSEFNLTLPEPYPHPMPYPKGCERCGQKSICMDICRIIQFDLCNPTCFKHPKNLQISTACSLQKGIDDNTQRSFRSWVNILNEIRIVNHKKYSDILTAKKSVNINNGKILELTDMPLLESTSNNKYLYKLFIKEGNYSEFRDFDIVIVSDKYNLEKANLDIGVIKRLTFEYCLIELNRKLEVMPKFIFPYYPDHLEYLNFAGLYKGFFGETKLYKLLTKTDDNFASFLNDIKIELIQGVPGSGKTTEIVKK
jgi:hypothetical protein